MMGGVLVCQWFVGLRIVGIWTCTKCQIDISVGSINIYCNVSLFVFCLFFVCLLLFFSCCCMYYCLSYYLLHLTSFLCLAQSRQGLFNSYLTFLFVIPDYGCWKSCCCSSLVWGGDGFVFHYHVRVICYLHIQIFFQKVFLKTLHL